MKHQVCIAILKRVPAFRFCRQRSAILQLLYGGRRDINIKIDMRFPGLLKDAGDLKHTQRMEGEELSDRVLIVEKLLSGLATQNNAVGFCQGGALISPRKR